MKITRNWLLPQVELGPMVGGLKVLYQRSGSLVFQPVTMVGSMLAAWGTNPGLRALFQNSLTFYFASVLVLGLVAMTGYYIAILPSEQRFNQGQSQRAERSPLKQDTETILERLDSLEASGNDSSRNRGEEIRNDVS